MADPVFTDEQIEKLAEFIHERMAQEILRLPADFKEYALGNYILPPMQIPMRTRNDDYFLLHIRITERYQMIFRLSNMFGEILKEWIME